MWEDKNTKKPGRLSWLVHLSRIFEFNRVIFGSGATFIHGRNVYKSAEIGTLPSADGKIYESEYSKRFLASALTRLIQEGRGFQGVPASHLKSLLSIIENNSICDVMSKNTSEEILNAFSLCIEDGVDALVFVTNPSHAPRVAKMASSCRDKNNALQAMSLFVSPCSSDFGGELDTIIFEPPSSPSSIEEINFCQLFQDFFKMPTSAQAELYYGVKKLLDKQGR